MKKLLFTLIMVFSAIFVQAQNEHLKFKGIPIAGDLDTFVTALEQQGFYDINDSPVPNSATLTGEFTNRDAVILVVANNNKKDVWKVAVMFDGTDKWDVLERDYQTYKDMFIEKYGKPKKVKEEFDDKTASSYLQLYELHQGRCTYATLFELKEGYIAISIVPYGTLKGAILLEYEDEINGNKSRKSAIDDI